MYLTHLKREPDSGGMVYWLDQLNSKRQSLDSIEMNIQLSAKTSFSVAYEKELEKQASAPSVPAVVGANSVGQSSVIEDQIKKLYQVYLGRAPDLGGLKYYSDLQKSGTPISIIELSIRNSSEAQIRQIYISNLKHEPSLGRMSFLLGQLNSGKATLASITLSLREEAEFSLVVAYLDFLKRDPDQSGLNKWIEEVKTGQVSIQQAVHIIKVSPEAIRSVISRMYQLYLFRQADSSGLDYWSNEVTSRHQTLTQVENHIKNSAEAQSKISFNR